MRRSSFPLFGDLAFLRCSRDEFERCFRPSRAYHQEGMGSGVIRSADVEARLV